MIKSVHKSLKLPKVIVVTIILLSMMYIAITIITSEGFYSPLISITIIFYFLFLISQLFVFRNFPIYHPILIYLVWREFIAGLAGDYMLLLNVNKVETALGGFYGFESQEIITKLFLLKTFSFIGFFIGFYAFKNIPIVNAKQNIKKIKSFRFKVSLLLMFLLILVTYLANMVGGIEGLLNQRSIIYYERITETIGGQYHAIVRAIPIFLVLICCNNINYLKKPIFLLSLLASYVSVFIVTGNRSVIITSIIMIALLHIMEKNKIQWKQLLATAIIIVITFGALGTVRSSDNEEKPSAYESIAFTYDEVKQRAIYVNGVVPIMAKVPEDIDWLYGRSYLSVPFIFIPSVVLPFEKPAAGGRITTDLIYKRDDTGIPPTPLGEAYWNFGIFGVIFLYAILGLIISFLYNNYKRSPKAPVVKFLYIYSILSLTISTDNLFNFFQFITISLILYIFFVFDISRERYSKSVS